MCFNSWDIFFFVTSIFKNFTGHISDIFKMKLAWSSANDRLFCHFEPFLAFLPQNPKNQNFEKIKKIPRDIIILQVRNINDNYMIYGSWDMEHDGQNFFVILDLFCPKNLKNQNFEKMKKKKKNIWRYYHFTHLYQKSWSYAILFLRYGAWQM